MSSMLFNLNPKLPLQNIAEHFYDASDNSPSSNRDMFTILTPNISIQYVKHSSAENFNNASYDLTQIPSEPAVI